MAFDNRLELVIDVDAKKGNVEIQSVNRNLSELESQSVALTSQWGSGMDRMAVDAARSMSRSSQEIREAKDAARLLGHQIGIVLPGAVTNFIAKSSALGSVLTGLFKASIWLAAGAAIWEAVKRTYEWATATEKVSDATKRINEQLKTSIDRIIELRKQRELAGLTGTDLAIGRSIQFGAEADRTRMELAALRVMRETLQKVAAERETIKPGYASMRGGIEITVATEAAKKAKEGIAAIDKQILALEIQLSRVEEERKTIANDLLIAKREEAKQAAERIRAEREQWAQNAAREHMEWQLFAGQKWGEIIKAAADVWQKNVLPGIIAARQEQDQLIQRTMELKRQLDQFKPRGGALTPDESGRLDPDLAPSRSVFDEAIRQGQMIRDEQMRIFDSLKRQAEGVFDALLTRSRSVFDTIASAFKTAMLTAIKEVVTSQVARVLMQMFGALRIPVDGGGYAGAGGGAGGVTGIMAGAMPMLAAGGGGAGGGFGLPAFMPSGGGGVGGSLFNLGGLKQFLGMSQAPGFIGPQIPFGQLSLGGKLSALGRSPAALLGGATLAMLGLQRGGASGLAMTTAGGALIGFKYGGPLGAAIGAGVGAAAGIIRLFVKGAREKAREKIKATYGVDIKDKGVLGQIVDMAKQGFGGNLDMAIRSQQVRDLVELYAMTTGQGTGGLPARMTPLSLVQSGGSIYQQSGGGGPSTLPGGLPGSGLDRIGAGSPSGGAMNLTINLSPEAAQDLLTKGVLKIVSANARAVQSASTSAIKGNHNRRELTSLQLSPGTLTS